MEMEKIRYVFLIGCDMMRPASGEWGCVEGNSILEEKRVLP